MKPRRRISPPIGGDRRLRDVDLTTAVSNLVFSQLRRDVSGATNAKRDGNLEWNRPARQLDVGSRYEYHSRSSENAATLHSCQEIQGFSLVELVVVIVIVGILASFGVPRFLKSVEKAKAAESFGYLAAVRSAQERYQSKKGTYASSVDDLDLQCAPPNTSASGASTPGRPARSRTPGG